MTDHKISSESKTSPPVKRKSTVVQVLQHLTGSSGGRIGGGIILLLVACALFAPLMTPYDPIKMSPQDALSPPSLKHLAGTDRFGRDILTRIIYGSRISLKVGFAGVSIAVVVGGLLGLLSGYYSGWVDGIICYFTNILLALPGILLALVVVAALGPGISNVMIAVGISSIPNYIRVVRGRTLSLKEQEFVDAARVTGSSDTRIIFRHILPNLFSAIVVLASMGFATAVLVGAAISFLGLGAQPPIPEWGIMVTDGRTMLRQAWWLSTMPGLAIMITALAFNLLGDSLRDALDPRVRI